MRERCVASIWIAATVSVAAGCTLEPQYRRPDLPVVDQWDERAATTQAPAGGLTDAATDIGWRAFFTDPAIRRLIEVALANNRDARAAASNVAIARAQYGVQRAELFPSIDVTAQDSIERYPTPPAVSSSGSPNGGLVGGNGSSPVVRNYSVGVGFTSFELDLFGRIRSGNHEKLEQVFSAEQTRRSIAISLVAEVANAWLAILADQRLLAVTRDTLDSRQASYDITRRAYEGNVQTALAVRQAETELHTARATLARFTRQLAKDRDALVLLLGAPVPTDLPAGAEIDGVHLLDDLSPGLPSQLLERRPDILAAEHNLIAANANIGVARAAFFPSITLTGSFGTASGALSGLFGAGSRAWTFVPELAVPLFRGGANVANLDLANFGKDYYVAQYEKTIQIAFKEVADALAARGSLLDELGADLDLERASRETYRLSDRRFSTGVDGYLNVLDAQRVLFGAQQSVVEVQLSRLQNLVTLYKALGGGWSEFNTEGRPDSVAASDATAER